MIVRISSLDRILSIRAFCTLRILPRSGRIAWKLRSRPCLAEPPAESPSTRYSSVSLGSVTLQSASLPGSNPPSRPLRLRTSSRALRAASRARAALTAFAMMVRATLGLLSKNPPRASLTTLLTIPSTSELPSLVLVCPSNCGSFTLTCSTAVSPSRTSSPVSVNSSFLRSPSFFAHSLIVRVRAARNPEVGAALVRVDVVDEAEGVVVVTVVVLDRALDLDSLPLGLERDRFRVQRLAVAEQVLHELGEPALVDERLFLQRALALVLERDGEALVQEGELAQPGGKGGVVEPGLREDRGVRLEPDGRAGALRLADHLELLRRLAALERHVMALAVAVHPHLQLLRQRVDYGDPHPVQPARHLVGRLVELAAGVEHRQRHLDPRLLLGLVNVDRNAAAVVDHGDGIVLVDGDVNPGGKTGQGLVHRIVHHLVDEMVEATPGHRSDVHRRAAPDRLEPLQDLDRVGLVVAVPLVL